MRFSHLLMVLTSLRPVPLFNTQQKIFKKKCDSRPKSAKNLLRVKTGSGCICHLKTLHKYECEQHLIWWQLGSNKIKHIS